MRKNLIVPIILCITLQTQAQDPRDALLPLGDLNHIVNPITIEMKTTATREILYLTVAFSLATLACADDAPAAGLNLKTALLRVAKNLVDEKIIQTTVDVMANKYLGRIKFAAEAARSEESHHADDPHKPHIINPLVAKAAWIETRDLLEKVKKETYQVAIGTNYLFHSPSYVYDYLQVIFREAHEQSNRKVLPEVLRFYVMSVIALGKILSLDISNAENYLDKITPKETTAS